MLKRITLFLYVVFNLNIYSQVVIKDEIVLDETDSPDAEDLTMPFYGKITGNVNSSCYDWCGLKLVKIEANGQTVEKGFYHCGGGWVSSFWAITNLPAGTPVEIKVYTCVNNVFTEAQTELQSIGANQYKVRFYSGTHEDWYDATTFEFIVQTPPGCDPQFDCALNNNLPGILLEERENGYRNIDVCSYGQIGATLPVFDDPNVNTIDINVCFNKQTQKWWFNLNNNHNLIFSYISEICPENLPASQSLKENFTYFPQGLTCDKISDDIFCHFAYGAAGATYLLRNIIEKHEEEHIKQIDSLINKIYKPKFYEKLDNIIKQCEDFTTLEEAEQFWNKTLRELFGQLVTDLKKNYKEMKAVVGFEDETHAKIFGFIYSEWENAMEYWNCNQ